MVKDITMPFMVRDTGDDFQTLLAVNAMEAAGAQVVAITTAGKEQSRGALVASARVQVWARITDDDHIGRVDGAIDAAR
jgi:hypothetical protein